MEDKALIDLIRLNPDKGIHKAIQSYGKPVNTICRAILRDYGEDMVDEAVSDTFFKLWKNSHQFSVDEGGSLKSYIYSIARNSAIDIRRKNCNNPVLLDEEYGADIASDFSVEEEIQKKEIRQILHEVIGLLGEPDSLVFLNKYFLLMKNKEIAKKMGLSEKKVENILYRGKSKLKAMLIERGVICYED
ncbi:MAG: sigma-70 family RNA polymerase sigma factor [Lachnospiraceae bacterium]|nr:sigma-70 family RNA polymerase sigma factor [Lachnospiraceae bacterium]